MIDAWMIDVRWPVIEINEHFDLLATKHGRFEVQRGWDTSWSGGQWRPPAEPHPSPNMKWPLLLSVCTVVGGHSWLSPRPLWRSPACLNCTCVCPWGVTDGGREAGQHGLPLPRGYFPSSLISCPSQSLLPRSNIFLRFQAAGAASVTFNRQDICNSDQLNSEETQFTFSVREVSSRPSFIGNTSTDLSYVEI